MVEWYFAYKKPLDLNKDEMLRNIE